MKKPKHTTKQTPADALISTEPPARSYTRLVLQLETNPANLVQIHSAFQLLSSAVCPSPGQHGALKVEHIRLHEFCTAAPLPPPPAKAKRNRKAKS